MMTTPQQPPIGVRLATDVEHRPGRDRPYRARVRWTDPTSKRRLSKSTTVATPEEAQAWLDGMASAAQGGVDPLAATKRLAEYGESVMTLALRGLERKTLDPYLAGWRKRVVPTLGHIPVRMITNGAVDRAVHAWIADEYSRSTVKNSLAVLVRVMEQAVRDGIIQRNPAQVTGWQREYQRAADELDDPRSLALPDWETLTTLAAALVDRSANHFTGWADVVIFAACTAARIGEVSGVRAEDIDRETWMWTVRRQTTPGPGGLIDKGTKGKRARTVPLIEEVRPIVAHRLDAATKPDSRLFTGPRGGRISTAVLRDATHWDEVVTTLGYEHLRRHDLRHTGLTWMADAGVPVHVLRKIAGHGSLTTTQRYLHPDRQSITDAGTALSAHLKARRSPGGPQLRAV
ncbi:phage integrase [Micromonospora sp. M42]|nr:phage integrase [Micromonospora sp. M42]